jgi:hypothetical protein
MHVPTARIPPLNLSGKTPRVSIIRPANRAILKKVKVTGCPFLAQLTAKHQAIRMPRGPKGEKRPADAIGDAVMIAKIATGEINETETLPESRFKISALRFLQGAAFSRSSPLPC